MVRRTKELAELVLEVKPTRTIEDHSTNSHTDNHLPSYLMKYEDARVRSMKKCVKNDIATRQKEDEIRNNIRLCNIQLVTAEQIEGVDFRSHTTSNNILRCQEIDYQVNCYKTSDCEHSLKRASYLTTPATSCTLINTANNLHYSNSSSNLKKSHSMSTTSPICIDQQQRTNQQAKINRFTHYKKKLFKSGAFNLADSMSLVSYMCLLILLLLSFNSSPLTQTSSSFIKFVAANQRFEAQPEREYLIPSGHSARLRCLVRERQGECLWLRNGRAVGNIARKYKFDRQPEDGDCSLQIQNVSVQLDDGLWQCQVTPSELDQDTLQSREVSLIVLVPPEAPQVKNTTVSTNSQQVSGLRREPD